MLRALGPSDLPPDTAYAVPWIVDIRDPAHVHLINASLETLIGVRVTVFDTGYPLSERAHLVGPAGVLTFAFPPSAPHESVVAIVAWTREDVEYIYRVTL